jgi:hypothetical protein
MKRARFETLQHQRDFFIAVKKKLGMGSRKLARKLNLHSHGVIENYTRMRTAPPLNLVQQLETLTNIEGKYTIFNGNVHRNKRTFMPMSIENAKVELKNRFPKEYNEIMALLTKRTPIVEITRILRLNGHTFDNCVISKAIGAHKTHMLSKLVNTLHCKENEIILQGYINHSKGSHYISFYLDPLSKIVKNNSIKVGLEISKDRKQIKIFPLSYGRKIHHTRRGMRILITKKSGLKLKDNINLILNPIDFGLDIFDTILDIDGRILAREALHQGFKLNPFRSTYNNYLGDIAFLEKGHVVIIEITRAQTNNVISKVKLGQCLMQTLTFPSAIHFIVCRNIFSAAEKKALKKLNTILLYTDFEENWDKNIIKQISDKLKDERFKTNHEISRPSTKTTL